MNRTFVKSVVVTVVAAFVIASSPIVQAGNAMIGTDAVIASIETEMGRDRLLAMLDSDAVVAALEAHGVSPEEARARVTALSDDELLALSSEIDSLPAGGNVVGVLFSVFLILLVTDLLGLTNVFPFTRN